MTMSRVISPQANVAASPITGRPIKTRPTPILLTAVPIMATALITGPASVSASDLAAAIVPLTVDIVRRSAADAPAVSRAAGGRAVPAVGPATAKRLFPVGIQGGGAVRSRRNLF